MLSKGWLVGYEGNSFKPDALITCAEVVAVLNRVLGRYVSEANIAKLTNHFVDLPESNLAYADILEATVSKWYNIGSEQWEEIE